MTQLENLAGKKFGLLTVLERIENTPGGNTRWRVRCDCGKETTPSAYNLKTGHTNSCGDRKHHSATLPKGESAFRILFSDMRRGAGKRGYSWNLSNSYVRNITSMNCYYCDRIPSQSINRNDSNGAYIYNGIDRINNSIGYTEENTVPCCKDCNYAKRERSHGEFISWVLDVHSNLLEYAEEVV